MHNTLKNMIERKRFKSLADCEKKLVTYHAADLIDDDEFISLIDLAREVYAE